VNKLVVGEQGIYVFEISDTIGFALLSPYKDTDSYKDVLGYQNESIQFVDICGKYGFMQFGTINMIGDYFSLHEVIIEVFGEIGEIQTVPFFGGLMYDDQRKLMMELLNLSNINLYNYKKVVRDHYLQVKEDQEVMAME
jgi:hypothetical protein